MDEVRGFEDLESVPHALWHHEGFPRSDRVARLVAGVVVIAVVEYHFEATGYEVQQFVTIWMQLTTVWRRAVHLTNYADREPVNSNRSTRTRHDL